jgi:hypothetical protein
MSNEFNSIVTWARKNITGKGKTYHDGRGSYCLTHSLDRLELWRNVGSRFHTDRLENVKFNDGCIEMTFTAISPERPEYHTVHIDLNTCKVTVKY